MTRLACWWIGFRFGKWGIGVYLNGRVTRWVDPQDLWGVLIGRHDEPF